MGIAKNIQSLNGVLVVNKPTGMVSKDVSRWLERRLGKSVKMGHVGTLDPGASGVLPIVFGSATRLQDHLLNEPKSYDCEILLGQETDTLDMDGQVIKYSDLQPFTLKSAQSAADSLRGWQLQTPPAYSAIKYLGKPLYSYARQGRTCDVDFSKLARKIFIEAFNVTSVTESCIRFVLTCSKGTYVRIAAQDLARQLGMCATVTSLCRTRAAGVSLSRAHSLDDIDKFLCERGQIEEPLLIPLNELKIEMPKLQLEDKASQRKLLCGQTVQASSKLLDCKNDSSVLNSDEEASPDIIAMLKDNEGVVFGLGTVRFLGGRILNVALKRSLA